MTTEPTKSEQRDAANELALTKSVPDSLLVVFIHGFKGTDQTFREFPKRLEHILSETISNVKVECLVFPAYEVTCTDDKAVVRFADWLTTLTVEREVASGGEAGNAKIVLCGHSMGGLLAADTLREFVNSRPDAQAPLWPKIIACIAFDTPYYGLHPFVVKNSATKYADAAKSIGTLLGSFPGFSAKTTTPPPNLVHILCSPLFQVPPGASRVLVMLSTPLYLSIQLQIVPKRLDLLNTLYRMRLELTRTIRGMLD
ncbi:uncharacterized protein LACBIDRAFT_311606 [Laccaria bicolor S238N-H82]|uniref:Predicted protein n=1 Tax=Laccaria bicolor (strain S238N-H82 / ATCC MYA-4686) TaxID=486041 RepID=B0CXT6_LACBS|nr:uncharacterized protein LACBIDRAFT_311606 [Laccaria bicolor S238N-H82]EDR12317.1 predicted protein [Laccaria bicolor S238N-H82]|eukprot:XP_001876581.1 predicted protein [Laccaria bicolor S238N-H82]